MKNKINPPASLLTRNMVTCFGERDLESELELNFPVYLQNLEWFESIFPVIPLKTVSLLFICVNFSGTRISMSLYVAHLWQMLEEQPTELVFFLSFLSDQYSCMP